MSNIAAMYLEIGPLQDPFFTGVSRVVCQLAVQMLAETDFEVRFFVGRSAIPRSVVEELVHMDSGREFVWFTRSSAFPPISALSASPSVGIFGNVKPAQFLFDYEAQIIHDLSVLMVPQFHTRDTIVYHSETLVRDLLSNDLNVCVSYSTRNDLERYFPEAPPNKNLVAHPAWYWPDQFQSRYDLSWADLPTENYILVLGTIEPRKNVDLVLDFIAKNPTITNQYKFLFLGKHGWGETFVDQLKEHKLTNQYENGRVVSPGFVGEFTKYVMLARAALVIYPSLFEGFGLPVVEALSLGKAVVTTPSSSIPEAGGDAVYYFNPFERGSFGVVLSKALYDVKTNQEKVASRARQQAAKFSWAKFYLTIKNRISKDLEKESDLVRSSR